MIKVLPLVGFDSLRALNVFSALMLGLKMLPAYRHEAYEPFLERVENMPPEDQEKMIREAALFVQLERDEVEALMKFCADPNGVRYTKENLNNLGPDQIFEIIVAVCKEIAKIKITLVTEAEKKN